MHHDPRMPGLLRPLPNPADWQRSYRRTVGLLERTALRVELLTHHQAPARISTATVHYMLSPTHVERLAKVASRLSASLYNMHVLVGAHRTDPADLPDLEHARQHLRAAADSLTRIQRRHGEHR